MHLERPKKKRGKKILLPRMKTPALRGGDIYVVFTNAIYVFTLLLLMHLQRQKRGRQLLRFGPAICVLSLLLYMCPHTTKNVSSTVRTLNICVLMNIIYVFSLVHVLAYYYYICTTIFVSSYYYVMCQLKRKYYYICFFF